MPEFFLELFSEEIPARLQAPAAEALRRMFKEAAAALSPSGVEVFCGPRRLALAAEVQAATAASASSERGPRTGAPEQALAGFLRKHGAAREALRQDGDFWVLDRAQPAVAAAAVIASLMPGLLRTFAWPKSMRWGGTSAFTWIRPLRRIVCLLDGAVVPFALVQGDDDGHGLAAGDLTEGHRNHAPGGVTVRGLADWRDTLLARHVVVDAGERAAMIRDGLDQQARDRGLLIVEDAPLLDEVAGLVEWPVPLFGRIDAAFMNLPAEVMQVSMRANQRYFAVRKADGAAAPWFAFVANVAAPDGGAAIVAGNERVLRARFSDARHFWELDRRTRLADRVGALESIIFHAALGTQGARVRRIVRLAGVLAPLVGADVALAERAAMLCKADLTTGMVAEFPELQGVMGGYYAAHDGENAAVCAAVREHYAPKGVGDGVPSEPVTIAVALADKLDQLAGFFSIGRKPTGSGDPFALRRAALGALRIIRGNTLRLDLRNTLVDAVKANRESQTQPASPESAVVADELKEFINERLRVMLRAEGLRHDVLDVVFAANSEDPLYTCAFAVALQAFIDTEEGRDLLVTSKRALNILQIAERANGKKYDVTVWADMLVEPEEQALHQALTDPQVRGLSQNFLSSQRFTEAMSILAKLRSPLDAFLDRVTINGAEQELRENRLRLLGLLRFSLNHVGDFSQIEF